MTNMTFFILGSMFGAVVSLVLYAVCVAGKTAEFDETIMRQAAEIYELKDWIINAKKGET